MISLWFLYVSLCLVWFEALDHHWEQELVAYLHRNPGPHLEDLRENAPCITQSSTQKLWAKLTRVIWNHWSQPCLIMFVYVIICLYMFAIWGPTKHPKWQPFLDMCGLWFMQPGLWKALWQNREAHQTKTCPNQTKCMQSPRTSQSTHQWGDHIFEMLWNVMNIYEQSCAHIQAVFSILPHLVSEQICCQTWWVQVEMNNHKKTQITTHVGTNMNKYE